MSEFCKQNCTMQKHSVGEFPVGYRNTERNEVDMQIIVFYKLS